eukprot:6199776-Pleurochrysis_carterae.AAC.1
MGMADWELSERTDRKGSRGTRAGDGRLSKHGKRAHKAKAKSSRGRGAWDTPSINANVETAPANAKESADGERLGSLGSARTFDRKLHDTAVATPQMMRRKARRAVAGGRIARDAKRRASTPREARAPCQHMAARAYPQAKPTE